MSAAYPFQLQPYQQAVFDAMITAPADHSFRIMQFRREGYRMVCAPKNDPSDIKRFNGKEWVPLCEKARNRTS